MWWSKGILIRVAFIMHVLFNETGYLMYTTHICEVIGQFAKQLLSMPGSEDV